MKAALLCLALFAGPAFGQQPYAQPPQYAIYYQPVAVPGQYYYVPRYTWVGDLLFGPQFIFIPQQRQQVPQR